MRTKNILILKFLIARSATNSKFHTQICFFLGFSGFQVMACKADDVSVCFSVCVHTKKSIQTQHNRRSLNLKNGVLKVFFQTPIIGNLDYPESYNKAFGVYSVYTKRRPAITAGLPKKQREIRINSQKGTNYIFISSTFLIYKIHVA